MKLNLSNITSGYGAVAALNANFDAIEQAVENTLSRDGTTPNEMEANLDMNGNNILNADTINTASLVINGTPVQPSTGVTVASAFQSHSFVATAAQTSFSVAPFTPYSASVVVEVNGIVLPPSDISVSGTNVVIPACTVGDEVVIRRFTDTPSPFPNADDISFNQSGTVQTRSVQSKLRDVVSVKDFGAVGDGITDDTAAIHAAINAVLSRNGAVHFPAGKYRVTSGYTNSTSNSVTIYGDGFDYAASTSANSDSSCVILDSTNANSFFYSQTGVNNLTVENMQFSCAQYVLDRKFFVQGASSNRHTFRNVHFTSVERPFVYVTGCYFQLNVYENVRFMNSGTFHSTTSSLIGTFMRITNVDVEGTIPENSEKIICNLQGIRQIQCENFVIEPATPSSGWIGLLLRNYYDPDWVRFPTATFRGFWVEVTGSGLTYAVQQDRGRSLFIAPQFNNGIGAPLRLTEGAAIEISDASFSGTADPLQSYFSFSDYLSQVKLTSCNYRNAGTAINSVNITLDNCSNVPAGGAGSEPFRATNHNNAASQLMWAFDGGYPDPGKLSVGLFSGTTLTPTVNAAFGRALQIIPNAGAINATLQILTRGDFPIGSQFFLVLRATMPTLSSGTTAVNMLVNGSTVANPANYTSGQDIRLVYPIATSTSNPANVGININTAAATGNLLIYQLELWIGKSMPSVNLPSHPAYVTTYNTAAPTIGQWNRGDRVVNSAPAVGSPKAWTCTVAGTPGTWVSEGNL